MIKKIMLNSRIGTSLLVVLLLLNINTIQAQRHMEDLDRGTVAIRTDKNKVFVSWRMLGAEPEDVGYNLYRGSTKVNSNPITNSTNYVDNTTENEDYSIRAVIDGEEQTASAPVSVWAEQYKIIPIQQPTGGTGPDGVDYTYTANDCSVGDLDGDGKYEFIVKWRPTNSKDNSQNGYTGNVYLDAYEMDGTHLWRIDLGKNIRAGAHYTQFVVYDLDSDGKAEVACKTADGTIDGKGEVIGDGGADYRNDEGRILAGPEFLTIFNGQTGAALETTKYLPARHPDTKNPTAAQLDQVWGDGYGNRMDRFLAGVAYLDGTRPSLIMCRGYYSKTVLVAWDWRDGELVRRWIFDSDTPGNEKFAGQGNHNLSIGDVDNDGKDEIIYGAMAVDDNGTGMYASGFGHGDAMHLSDLDPTRPGMEVFTIHEPDNTPGASFRDAHTGEILWKTGPGDVGRGIAIDVDPRYPGAETWGFGGMRSAQGEVISQSAPYANFAVWWDGDLLRELLSGTTLDKWNFTSGSKERILTAHNYGAADINGTKANPNLSADILGDWREEIIYRKGDDGLMIFTTTIPTTYRFPTLMHDPQYRISIAWQNVAYNQPPHTSFFLGHGMEDHTAPDIELVTVGTDPADSDMVPEVAVEENDEIKIYPNSSAKRFLLEVEGEFSYTITNQFGEKVEEGTGENKTAVGFDLDRGIYTAKIDANEGDRVIKLIKK